MDNTFIDLERRFEEYRTDEIPEDQAHRSYVEAYLGHEEGLNWDDLLRSRLVIVLGEPGSGKTQELKAQYRRLQPKSFFLPLDRLVGEDVTTILDDEETQQLKQWKEMSYAVTFFLDAVDESKIRRDNDFFIALDRVKKTIGPSLAHARFVISSRISEWRPQTDREAVLRRLGLNKNHIKHSRRDSLRSSITGSNAEISQDIETIQTDKKESSASIKIVKLLPLVDSQIKRYAKAFSVRSPENFIKELENNDAWAFAGRPLDVRHLYLYWNDKGHLSNLTDLTEYMVNRLLDEVPNKEKLDPLSPKEVRLGAEYLAAAVVICRRLRIQVGDEASPPGENLISPTKVLPTSWMPRKRRAMTDRALFDAVSRGTISFHHRYHAEYLAAAWIERLMDSNCTMDALDDLLFAYLDGQRVLRPSLAPVAAWLIKHKKEPWRQRLAERMLESAAEIHFVYGDPAALTLDYRRRIFDALVQRYNGRKRVNISWDRAAIARLADEGLAEDINRYLIDVSIAENLRADLLMVVCEGKLLGCIQRQRTAPRVVGTVGVTAVIG